MDREVGWDSAGVAKTYSTIASAVAASSAGDRVVLFYENNVQSVTYNENFTTTIPISIVSGIPQRPSIRTISMIFQNDRALTIEDIQYDTTTFQFAAGSSGSLDIKRCIGCGGGSGASISSTNGCTITIENCLYESMQNDVIRDISAGGEVFCQNVTVNGGILRGFWSVHCTNCVAVGTGQGFRTTVAGSDYNCSDDGTEPGANSISKKFLELDYYAEDVSRGRIGTLSPLVGAGTTTGQPSTDLFGNTYSGGTIGCIASAVISADADTILDSVTGGNWTAASSNLYLAPNQYGVGGTSVTGTFSADAPTQPTLAVVNNDDGTATATISGADSSSENTVYMFGDEMTVSPTAVATITESGSEKFTVSPIGIYWFYAVSSVSGVTSLSTTIERVDVSDGSDAAESSEDQYIRQNGELFTVQNQVVMTDSNFARKSTWSDSHQAYGWMQSIGSDLREMYEQRQLVVDAKVWFAEDPQAAEGDRIQKADGTAYVIQGVIEQAGQSRLWRVDVQELK